MGSYPGRKQTSAREEEREEELEMRTTTAGGGVGVGVECQERRDENKGGREGAVAASTAGTSLR